MFVKKEFPETSSSERPLMEAPRKGNHCKKWVGTFCTGTARTGAVRAPRKMLPGTGKKPAFAFTLVLPKDMAALALTKKG